MQKAELNGNVQDADQTASCQRAFSADLRGLESGHWTLDPWCPSEYLRFSFLPLDSSWRPAYERRITLPKLAAISICSSKRRQATV